MFRVRSTGKAGQTQSDIVAIVYDADKVRSRLEKALVEQATKGASGADSGANDSGKGAGGAGSGIGDSAKKDGESGSKDQSPAPAPLRRPKIVYWNEQ